MNTEEKIGNIGEKTDVGECNKRNKGDCMGFKSSTMLLRKNNFPSDKRSMGHIKGNTLPIPGNENNYSA